MEHCLLKWECPGACDCVTTCSGCRKTCARVPPVLPLPSFVVLQQEVTLASLCGAWGARNGPCSRSLIVNLRDRKSRKTEPLCLRNRKQYLLSHSQLLQDRNCLRALSRAHGWCFPFNRYEVNEKVFKKRIIEVIKVLENREYEKNNSEKEIAER